MLFMTTKSTDSRIKPNTTISCGVGERRETQAVGCNEAGMFRTLRGHEKSKFTRVGFTVAQTSVRDRSGKMTHLLP